MSLNICGFLHHKDELVSWINCIKPDVICLNETHVSEDVLDQELHIQNYNISRTNTTNNRTGGVLILIKNNIKFEISDSSDTTIHRSWINIIQLKGKDKLIICNLYRSPNCSISKFCDDFNNLVESYVDVDRTVILGDFNIDVLKDNYY